jgi:hypothetical protein
MVAKVAEFNLKRVLVSTNFLLEMDTSLLYNLCILNWWVLFHSYKGHQQDL